jgi:ActR/RegA family two-component response regulator
MNTESVVDFPSRTLFDATHLNPGRSMEPKRNVLVVDDEAQVCTMLKRAFGPSFDQVLTATSCAAADVLLKDGCVTHLVCDYMLGAGQPLGTAAVVAWRKAYPTITRALIFTGSDIANATIPPEVDAVLSKTESVKVLLRGLIEG